MPEFCEKLIFELEAFSYQNELESSKAVDVTSENVLYFNIWVSCPCTFNPSLLLLKWDLWWPWLNNIQKHGEQTVMQNYLHDEDKGVREETIF